MEVDENQEADIIQRTQLRTSCIQLENLQTNVPILILDENFLKNIRNGGCQPSRKIKVGVEYPAILKDSRFEVVSYKIFEDKDYLELGTIPKRVIPRRFKSIRYGNVKIAENIPQFLEFLRRSMFIECVNLEVSRTEKDKEFEKDSEIATESLARIRDYLIDFDMFPFMFGGTLLGWYRECNLIPHTNDMDLAVFFEEWNPKLWEHLQKNESEFRLWTKHGKVEDSFDLTLIVKRGYRIPVDIFLMYKEVSEQGIVTNYVGGSDDNSNKFKYSYPEYDPYCAADLFGHIFWVTCSPVKQLTNEYGRLWFKDHPSRKYNWTNSHKNVKPNGKWSNEDLEQMLSENLDS